MRVVHVTTVPETLGFLSGQCRCLCARGVEVLAVSSPGEALHRFGREEGIPCFGVPMERGISPARDLASLARLTALLRRLRPTIVDAHTPKAGLLAMMAARLARAPVAVYHLHGLRFATETGLRRRVLRATDRVAAALATRVLAVSPSLARAAVAAGLAPRDKIRVLGHGSINGVDPARFHPPSPDERRAARVALGLPPDALVVGFVGRLARDKGVVELWGAWRALREELPALRLVLVGPAEPGDPIPPGIARALAEDPRVVTAGFVVDPRRWYLAMDVLALPSHREGFGVVSIEAAATGLPVVATSVTGCVDAVVDGTTGTLVPPGDAAGLAAALRRYLEDPALRARHGASGRARAVREFDPVALCEALHDEYEALAAAARPGASRAGLASAR